MEGFHPELQDIFHVPRLLGAFPFNERFRLSKKLLAYCVIVRLVSALGAIDACFHPSPLYAKLGEGVSIIVALRTLAVVSALGDNFFTIHWWIRKRDTVTLFMENINQVLRRNKVKLKRRRIRFLHYLLFVACATYVFSYYIYSYRQNSLQNARNEFSYFLSSSSTLSFIGQFWDLLHLLSFLFEESTRLYDESSVISYERFSTLSEMINEIYEPQVLFTITQFFIQIIFCLYILLLPLHPGMNPSNILTSILAFNCVIPIASIISACNKYTNQVSKIISY